MVRIWILEGELNDIFSDFFCGREGSERGGLAATWVPTPKFYVVIFHTRYSCKENFEDGEVS